MSNKKCSTCRREFPAADFVGEKGQETRTRRTCRDRAKPTKCAAKDRNGAPCRASIANEESRFCKNHLYMCDYTDEMLAHTELCSGCKKMYFLDGYKICENCRARSGKVRECARENLVLCAREGCTYKRSDENEFCGHHKLQQFIKETADSGRKLCYNNIRGCRAQLETTYSYSKCEDCLKKDREKDKLRRINKQEENIIEKSTVKCCSQCKKEYPLQDFIGEKQQETKMCQTCREKDKTRLRDNERRKELAREASKKPENIEKKKQWKEENKEKVAMIWMNYRQRQIQQQGVEEYLKQNAEQAKKWRENNPEKVKENNEKRKNSIEYQYNIYLRSAEIKNLEFKLSHEDFDKIVNDCCYYCGIIQEKGFNGIDRKNQTLGYIHENCASCCKMCNFMKMSLIDHVFLKRVEHILTYNKIIYGKLFPELFADHKTSSYTSYRNRAFEKGIEFVITNEVFDKIVSGKCYMCGKECTETHKNGIDRFDNSIGYTIENCRTCCGECNYMKKQYSHDDIIQKFIQINKKHGISSFQKVDNTVSEQLSNITCIIKTNKKQKDELKIISEEKRERKKEELIKRYNDEDYKKKRAEEIASNVK